MGRDLLRAIRSRILAGRIPQGERGIRLLGHRLYVGGKWEEIGKLQFDYLVRQGLGPQDCFLDIACGALRGGVHFIRYLDAGRYLGLDREAALVEKGIEQELGQEVYEEKRPEFVISSSFEFHKFSQRPRMSLALSLFTHLTSADIQTCLANLRDHVDRDHIFFTTFFEGDSARNKTASHSLDHFEYSRDEMQAFGEALGWDALYIGDWNHPRNQMMMRYTAR